MNNFYVYQLRVEEQQEPFYVGKGVGDRAFQHFNQPSSLNDSNKHKVNTIKKALSEGKRILVDFLFEGLSEEEAFRREVWSIKMWGRKSNGEGPLTNLTDGGEGASGMAGLKGELNPSNRPEVKAKIAAKLLGNSNGSGYVRTPEHREAIRASKIGKPRDEATRLKLSIAQIGRDAGLPKPSVVCPHCGKVGGKPAMIRHHFDNCKKK